jgi:hypothetical protein
MKARSDFRTRASATTCICEARFLTQYSVAAPLAGRLTYRPVRAANVSRRLRLVVGGSRAGRARTTPRTPTAAAPAAPSRHARPGGRAATARARGALGRLHRALGTTARLRRRGGPFPRRLGRSRHAGPVHRAREIQPGHDPQARLRRRGPSARGRHASGRPAQRQRPRRCPRVPAPHRRVPPPRARPCARGAPSGRRRRLVRPDARLPRQPRHRRRRPVRLAPPSRCCCTTPPGSPTPTATTPPPSNPSAT